MNILRASTLVVTALLSTMNQAFAFNFGFVRVPDWMDSYIAGLMIAALFSYLGLAVTKPRGIPVNQLSRVKVSPLANFFRIILLISFALLMLMLFAGMGLRRFAEG